MIVSTTPTIQNKEITDYLGLVSGETIIGANIIKDFLANITDFIGGRSGAYEKVLKEARGTATKEMIATASGMGANAIVGIDIDYESIGSTGSMLMVTVTGTAVRVG